MVDTLNKNQLAYRRKLEREAEAPKAGPRLTLKVAKAVTIRCPETGRKLSPNDGDFRKWKRKFS